MALVLILTTGLVSSQFHVKHNTLFDVVKQKSFNSSWKSKSGFVVKRKHKTVSTRNNITSIEKPKQDIKNSPSQVSNIKRSIKFADPKRTKQAKKAAQSRSSISSTEENLKAEASSFYKGTPSIKSSQYYMPAYDIRITSSTLPNLVEAE